MTGSEVVLFVALIVTMIVVSLGAGFVLGIMTDHKNRVKRPTTVDEMLRLIDDFSERGVLQSAALWDILTALRGPDVDPIKGGPVKNQTTARIRAVALPKLSAYYALTNEDGLPVPDLAALSWPEGAWEAFHFRRHVWKAVEALRDIGRRI